MKKRPLGVAFLSCRLSCNMNDDFFLYLEKLEYLVFFSGYPILYALIMAMQQTDAAKNRFLSLMARLLPYGYALTGTLYLGYCADKLYPDMSWQSWKLLLSHSWLTPWAISVNLFWIRLLSRKNLISLLHSLPFLYLLISDLARYYADKGGISRPTNEMRMYGISILIHVVILLFITSFAFLFHSYRNKSNRH